jgi:hypothetical protein
MNSSKPYQVSKTTSETTTTTTSSSMTRLFDPMVEASEGKYLGGGSYVSQKIL